MQQSSGDCSAAMSPKVRRVERGFSVGELLMVASLLTFASTGVMSLVKKARKGNDSPPRLAYQQLILQGREAVDRIVQELGQAGTPSPVIHEGGSQISAANSNRIAASQFLVATGTQLIFEADLDRDGAVERVEYRLNGDILERSAVAKFPEGGAPAPIYEAMIGNVDNGAMPLFSYAGDPFGPSGLQDSGGTVRVLLLLRASSESKKQPYQTIGFEGIAYRHNDVNARHGDATEQSAVPRDDAAANQYFSEHAIVQETYARKWTLR